MKALFEAVLLLLLFSWLTKESRLHFISCWRNSSASDLIRVEDLLDTLVELIDADIEDEEEELVEESEFVLMLWSRSLDNELVEGDDETDEVVFLSTDLFGFTVCWLVEVASEQADESDDDEDDGSASSPSEPKACSPMPVLFVCSFFVLDLRTLLSGLRT